MTASILASTSHFGTVFPATLRLLLAFGIGGGGGVAGGEILAVPCDVSLAIGVIQRSTRWGMEESPEKAAGVIDSPAACLV